MSTLVKSESLGGAGLGGVGGATIGEDWGFWCFGGGSSMMSESSSDEWVDGVGVMFLGIGLGEELVGGMWKGSCCWDVVEEVSWSSWSVEESSTMSCGCFERFW